MFLKPIVEAVLADWFIALSACRTGVNIDDVLTNHAHKRVYGHACTQVDFALH